MCNSVFGRARTLAVAIAGQIIVFAAVFPARATDNDLNHLVQIALATNPTIVALKRQVAALQSKADASILWADPSLSIEYANVPWDSWALDRSPMSGVQFKIQQRVTLPGKNDRRKKVVQGEVAVESWALREQKNQLVASVKQTYWKLALVRKLREINERHIKLLDQLLAVTQVKFEVGQLGQHDLLSLQVLRDKLADDLGDYDQKEREFTALLNSSLHRNVRVAIKTPEVLKVAHRAQSSETLLETAKLRRPLLKKIFALSEWRRLAAEQIAYGRWPDFTVWFGYRARIATGVDSGTDFFNIGLTVPLPIDYTGRTKAQSKQNLLAANAVDSTYRATVDAIEAALERALAAWRRAEQKVARYQKDLVPAAKRTLEATLAAYQTGRAGFDSLYRAEVQLLKFEREAKVAAVTTHIQHSNVEALVGVRLAASSFRRAKAN